MRVNHQHLHDIGKLAMNLLSTVTLGKLEFRKLLPGNYDVLMLIQTYNAEETYTEEICLKQQQQNWL